MSQAEVELLIAYGRQWYGVAWVEGDNHARDGLVAGLNGGFAAAGLGLTVRRGWQHYDPVVRVNNTAHSYASITAWAAGHADGGRNVAAQLCQWFTNPAVTLATLPPMLRELAVLTHFCEVGRGYESSIYEKLSPWLDSIANAPTAAAARALWHNYTSEYPPSLRYDQDNAREFA
jgi:hypothetical protein